MKITSTLGQYITKRYVLNFLILLAALLSIIYVFETVELIRRASKNTEVPLGLLLQMSLLKLPEVGQTLLPFAILFSAMFTFWQLTRRYELIVVRSSGFSVWQFLMPITLASLLIGLIQITIINPAGAVFIGKFEEMERVHLKRQKNQIAVFKEGLWLRQAVHIDTTTNANLSQTPSKDGYIILHAQKVKQPEWILQKVSVMYFSNANTFIQRIDAKSATLNKTFWNLNDVTVHKDNNPPHQKKTYTLPTTLTVNDIQESFSSPESMSFWKLPAYIQTLEQTGFDATRLKVHYHNLLAQPLMFCAMILLAATVSMRPPRMRGTFIMICTGIFIGFFIFFISSFLQAMGVSRQIPVIMAAWSPAVISFLLGLTVMMNIEDG